GLVADLVRHDAVRWTCPATGPTVRRTRAKGAGRQRQEAAGGGLLCPGCQRLFEPAPGNCFARSPGSIRVRIGFGFGALGTSRVRMPLSNLAFISSARTSPGSVIWRW